MDDEDSLLWAVELSWVVPAQGPTHSCNQMVAGPRSSHGVFIHMSGPWAGLAGTLGLVEHLFLHAAPPQGLLGALQSLAISHWLGFSHGNSGFQE